MKETTLKEKKRRSVSPHSSGGGKWKLMLEIIGVEGQ